MKGLIPAVDYHNSLPWAAHAAHYTNSRDDAADPIVDTFATGFDSFQPDNLVYSLTTDYDWYLLKSENSDNNDYLAR